jgi:predicted amidohydrolase YtcJ
MKKYLLAALVIILIAGYFYITKDYPRTPSTLYFNGDVVTMEDDQGSAEAVYVEGGIIKAIGSNAQLDLYKSTASKVIDLKGQALLPGFIDPHTHPALSSFFSEMADLSGFKHKTNASIWNYLGSQVKNSTKGEWIICKGLDPVLVSDLVTPTKSFLDSIAPYNPVFIISQSIHSFWANSLAFAEAGIDKNTPDPSAASYYEKDENGELTGFLAEQLALIPFREKITEIQGDKIIGQSVNALKDYARNGNTTIVAMGLTGYEQRIVDF